MLWLPSSLYLLLEHSRSYSKKQLSGSSAPWIFLSLLSPHCQVEIYVAFPLNPGKLGKEVEGSRAGSVQFPMLKLGALMKSCLIYKFINPGLPPCIFQWFTALNLCQENKLHFFILVMKLCCRKFVGE